MSRAIGEGALTPGTKLPPIRTVAAALGLSPTTVNAAWQLLARSGAIRADGRRGTVVAQRRPGGPLRYRRALRRHASMPIDLATGVPDPNLLPDLGPALRRLHATAPSSYLDEPVLPDLAALLLERWPFAPERIGILDGAMDAMDQVASAMLRIGDRVVVEDPCFPPLLDLLEAIGAEVVGVPVDVEGLIPSELAEALKTGPAAVFLQPRAHNPTGASWTSERAKELAAVLTNAPATTIVEDDSAGDISSCRLFSLGQWLPERTIHIRSFAKSHGPDLRIAAVGGPAALLDPVLERRLLGQGWTSRLLQYLLLDLLTSPESVAAVDRARREYRRRQRLVCGALGKEGVEIAVPDGINLWLPVADEQAALIRLASEGIGAAAGAAFMVGLAGDPRRAGRRSDPGGHIRVTVGLLARQHARVAHSLARAAAAGPETLAHPLVTIR